MRFGPMTVIGWALVCAGSCGGDRDPPGRSGHAASTLPSSCQALIAGLTRCADGLPSSGKTPLEEMITAQRAVWAARKDDAEAFAAGCDDALETMRGATRTTCPEVSWTVPKPSTPAATTTAAPPLTVPSAADAP